ncbi:MAG: hypothetical protein HEP71_33045 [Roseivirga sp.]|nr:hypothetical protein [Roseivirga sp.]
MSKNESFPPDLLTYEVSTDPDPLYTNAKDSKLLITIKKNTDVYLDEIYIQVPASSSSAADTLFLTDPALTQHLTPDTKWVVSPGEDRRFDDLPYKVFIIKPKNSNINQITEDLHLTITGTTNTDKGTVQILISEESGRQAGSYTPRQSEFSVTKSEPIPFYLNNLVAFDSNDPDTPKVSFKTSDEIYLSWDSNGTSYELFPKDLLTTGNPTTNTHITIPAGKITKDQTILIKATKGTDTFYRSLLINIEDPDLTPTSSLIGGAGTGKTSFSVANGQSIINGQATINGDQFSIDAPTVINGDLAVQAPTAGTSTTHVDTLSATNADVAGTTHTHGNFRMYGDAATQEFASDLPVWFNSGLTTVGVINANGGINVPALNPVSLSQPPIKPISTKLTYDFSIVAELKMFTQGHLVIPDIGAHYALFSFKIRAQVWYPGSTESVSYEYFYTENPFGKWHGTTRMIPITQGTSVTLTISPKFLVSIPGQYLNFDLFWLPMGAGPNASPSYELTYFRPKTSQALEGEKFHEEHMLQAEKLLRRTEDVKSFIGDLEEAFEESLTPEAHELLTQNLEELL